MRAPEAHQVRLARNQSLYREVNERLAALAPLDTPAVLRVVCECADESCTERFDVTVEEYKAVRARPIRFLVVRGHVFPEVEDVVAEAESYVVVEKVEAGAETAAALYPFST